MTRIPVYPVTQAPQIQKAFRNRAALQPIITAGRLFIPEEFVELRHELATHPMNPICDLVDALENAVRLLPKRAASEVAADNLEAYARYLRRTNVPPDQIAALVAEKRRSLPSQPSSAMPAASTEQAVHPRGGGGAGWQIPRTAA